MPKTPRDLYNALVEAGEISATYDQFREKWDTPGWTIDLHKALFKKKYTKASYAAFKAAFSDPDPEYDTEAESPTVELTEQQLQDPGKGTVEPQPQLGPTKKDTASPGENISWATQEQQAKLHNFYMGQIDPDEPVTEEDWLKVKKTISTLEKQPIENPRVIGTINNAFPNDPEGARKAKLNTRQLDNMSKYIEKLEKEELPPPTPKTIGDRAVEAFLINMPLGLESAWDSTKTMSMQWLANVAGDDATDFLLNESTEPILFQDPETGEKISYKDDPKRWKELNSMNMGPTEVKAFQGNREVGSLTDEWVIGKLKHIQHINSQITDPGQIIRGVKAKDAGEVIGGVFNAVQGAISSIGPALLTRGASLAPHIVAPMWVDYNVTKAAAKYGPQPTYDAEGNITGYEANNGLDPITALVENNETDFVVPVSVGMGALAMEYMGFKGISKYIAGSKVGSKVMGLDWNKAAWMLTANKEGMTEWGQTGMETLNTTLAEGGSLQKGVKEAAKMMFSQEGFEMYLQGMAGSMGVTAPSALQRTAQRVDLALTRALHEDPNGHKVIYEGIDKVNELRELKLKTESKALHKTYDDQIKLIEKGIKTLLKENNKLLKHLSPGEQARLKAILNRKDAIAKEIEDINRDFDEGKMSGREKGLAISLKNRENRKLSNEIADLKENIDKSKVYTDIATTKKLATAVKDTDVVAFETQEQADDYMQEQTGSDVYSTGYGAIVTDKQTGRETIVINVAKALKDGRPTTGQHEFLHRVMAKTLATDDAKMIKLGNEVKEMVKTALGDSYLSSPISSTNKVYESRLEEHKKRLEDQRALAIAEIKRLQIDNATDQRLTDKDIAKVNQEFDDYISQLEAGSAEEAITLLSEALANGELKLIDKNRNTFQKAGELIRRALQKAGLQSVKIETAADVVQFVQDYNRNFEEGKLDAAIINMALGKEGIVPTLKRVIPKLSASAEEAIFTPKKVKESIRVGENDIVPFTIRTGRPGEAQMFSARVVLPGMAEGEYFGLTLEETYNNYRLEYYIPKKDAYTLDQYKKMDAYQIEEAMVAEKVSEKGAKIVDLSFYYQSPTGKRSMDLQNKFSPAQTLKLFGTIINSVRRFLLDRPYYDGVRFSGLNVEKSRTRLYASLSHFMGKEMGWDKEVMNTDRTGLMPPEVKEIWIQKKIEEYTEWYGKEPDPEAIANLHNSTYSSTYYHIFKKNAFGAIPKESASNDMWERTEKLYEEFKGDPQTAGFMIAMEWENQIEKKTRGYRTYPNYNSLKEDLVSDVMTSGSQSIVGLVKNYKPNTSLVKEEGEQTLPGWINLNLPRIIEYHAKKLGISTTQTEEPGFTTNVDDLNDLTDSGEEGAFFSSETADFDLSAEELSEMVEKQKQPTMVEAIKAKKHPELIDHLEKQVGLNLSGAMKKFAKPKSTNTRKDPFAVHLRAGLKDDAEAHGVMKKFILDYGYEQFLKDFKVTFLANTERADLAKSPFYKRVVQQRYKGVWKSRELYIDPKTSKASWEFLNDKGEPYLGRHPDMDRASAKDEKGNTAGHYFFRKNPDLASVFTDDEFINFHFNDGPGRRSIKPAPLNSMAKQFSAEMSMDLFAEQLNKGEGPIFEVFKGRVQIADQLTEAEKAKAIEKKYLIREGIAQELTDRVIAETLKDLERGGIKESRVNKVNRHYFDKPRINLFNYLAGLENNDVREGIVAGRLIDERYDELYDDMKQAYNLYLEELEIMADEGNLDNYAKAFKQKGYTYDQFIKATLTLSMEPIHARLGLQQDEVSMSSKNATNKQATKNVLIRFADAYIQGEKSIKKVSDVIKLVASFATSRNYSLFPHPDSATIGLYEDFVRPLLQGLDMPANTVQMEQVETGITLVDLTGKKITGTYSKGTGSPDIIPLLEAAKDKHIVENTLDIAERKKDVEANKKLFLDFINWLKDHRDTISRPSIAMILNGLNASSRSVQKQMAPLTHVMLGVRGEENVEYALFNTVEESLITEAAFYHILRGDNLNILKGLMEEDKQVLVPKTFVPILQRFSALDDLELMKVEHVERMNYLKIFRSELDHAMYGWAGANILQNSTAKEFTRTDLETYQNMVDRNFTLGAIKESLQNNPEPKGISVWDFDETLAKTKSKIKYKDDNGKLHAISPSEFAENGDALITLGYDLDFSDFSKVKGGIKGPMFDKAVKRNEKFGNEHVYILSARPQNSAKAIHKFLKGIGLDIKLSNIIGLQDSSPTSKAKWIVSKVAEGYNDFYFADDHLGNVQAVKEVLQDVDIKHKVVHVKESLAQDLNDMIARKTKIDGNIKGSEAKRMGRKIDASAKMAIEKRLFIGPNAEDFKGLMYKMLGSGKQGDADMKWLNDNFIDPYWKGVEALDHAHVAVGKEYKRILKKYPEIRKKLYSLIENDELKAKYTYDQAIRYYLYMRKLQNEDSEKNVLEDEVSSEDGRILMKTVMLDKNLRSFAHEISVASGKPGGYIEPDPETWLYGSIATDFKNFITQGFRQEALKVYFDNIEEAFTKKNMHKIEAAYGTTFKKALENAIGRHKTGMKGVYEGNDAGRWFENWLNGAIAPIMFLNRRSAVLQLLSMVNFVNWTDNNPIKALTTPLSNPKQFAKDFMMILNSDKLIARRQGLRISIEEAELANFLAGGKFQDGSWFKMLTHYLVHAGYSLTKAFDSLAIASGGAPFYRNRVNTYINKHKMSVEEAEAKAWIDFSKTADEAQQSSDQMLISKEQASPWGRIILAFANTPIQYTRLTKKAILDIANRRGSVVTNLSKIVYYGFVQNYIFAWLQNAVFAASGWFIDDPEKEESEEMKKIREQKNERLWNSIANSLLRGVGMYGALIAGIKDGMIAYTDRSNKGDVPAEKYKKVKAMREALDRNDLIVAAQIMETIEENAGKAMLDYVEPILSLASTSPATGAKARIVTQIMKNEEYNREMIAEKGWRLDSPRWRSVGLGAKAALNFEPIDYIQRLGDMKDVWHQGNNAQKAFMVLGWSPYDMTLTEDEFAEYENKQDTIRKETTAIFRKAKNELEKKLEWESLTPAQRRDSTAAKKAKRSESAKRAAETRKRKKDSTKMADWLATEKAIEAAREGKTKN